MKRFTVLTLAGGLLISSASLAAAAAPANRPHTAVTLGANAKVMVLKGPAHVDKLVTSGSGTAQVYEVATANATNAGCAAAAVAGTAPDTLSNNSTQEIKRDVPAGHILCATLTAGTSMALNWSGVDEATGTSGARSAPEANSVDLTLNKGRFMFKGPMTIAHAATGGDGQIAIYTMNTGAGTDADCMPPAPPPPAPAKPGTPPAAAPPPAAPGVPAGGAVEQKLAPRSSTKLNVAIPAGKSACAMLLNGSDGKLDWKLK